MEMVEKLDILREPAWDWLLENYANYEYGRHATQYQQVCEAIDHPKKLNKYYKPEDRCWCGQMEYKP